jgi:hypothetical protein
MSTASTHILNLISLYTTKEISESEFNELQQWLNKAPENKVLFSEYLLLYKKSRQLSFSEYIDPDKAWNKVVSRLEQPFMQIQKVPRFFAFGIDGSNMLQLRLLLES